MSEAEQQTLRYDIAPLPCQQLYFTTLAYGKLQPLFSEEPERNLKKSETMTISCWLQV